MDRALIDANLLVLLIVGEVNRGLIKSHRRLKEFEESNYDLLCDFLSHKNGILLTPNTLSQASDLVSYMRGPAEREFRRAIKRLAEVHLEHYEPSRSAVMVSYYQRLGLTDAAILASLRPGVTLLTVDLDLYIAAQTQGHSAVNFNHLRDVD